MPQVDIVVCLIKHFRRELRVEALVRIRFPHRGTTFSEHFFQGESFPQHTNRPQCKDAHGRSASLRKLQAGLRKMQSKERSPYECGNNKRQRRKNGAIRSIHVVVCSSSFLVITLFPDCRGCPFQQQGCLPLYVVSIEIHTTPR